MFEVSFKNVNFDNLLKISKVGSHKIPGITIFNRRHFTSILMAGIMLTMASQYGYAKGPGDEKDTITFNVNALTKIVEKRAQILSANEEKKKTSGCSSINSRDDKVTTKEDILAKIEKKSGSLGKLFSASGNPILKEVIEKQKQSKKAAKENLEENSQAAESPKINREQTPSPDPNAPRGLTNVNGNTCWFNSAMQIFSSSQAVSNRINRIKRANNGTASENCDFLQQLIDYLNGKENIPEAVLERYTKLVQECTGTTPEETSSDYGIDCLSGPLTSTHEKKLVQDCKSKKPDKTSPDYGIDCLKTLLTSTDKKYGDMFQEFYISGSGNVIGLKTKLETLPDTYDKNLPYLVTWNRAGDKQKVVDSPVGIPMYLSNKQNKKFPLTCIVCYSGTGTAGHYYVVKKCGKNWYTINDSNVTLKINGETTSEKEISKKINTQCGRSVLMALYDNY